MTSRSRWLAAALLALLASGGASAQEPDSAREAELPPLPTELRSLAGRPSPRGAMIRSFVLPGWGQASYDRYFRGGVYFMGHAANSYMVLKTYARLDEARDMEWRRVDVVRAGLIAAGVPADSLAIRVAEDEDVRRVRGLVDSREEQREDWVALGLFWVLVSGVDAYVMAQLADFPASIGALTDGRRYGVYVSIPVR